MIPLIFSTVGSVLDGGANESELLSFYLGAVH